MARTVPKGVICHNQKEIFTKTEIPNRPGSLIWGEDYKPDCETIWCPSQLGGVVEEIILEERAGSLLGEQHSPGIRETDCRAGAASRKEGSRDRVAKKFFKPEQMSTEEKVSLVREVKDENGLSSALAALHLPRSTWYYHQNHRVPYTEKYAYLRKPLEATARNHHEYGYLRTTPELREVYGYIVNHKVVQQLHQEWDLPLIRGTKCPQNSRVRKAIEAAADRINLVAGRETI